jgi:hypothetical protein
MEINHPKYVLLLVVQLRLNSLLITLVNKLRIIIIAHGGGWEFFSSPPRPDQLWGPSSLLFNMYQGLFP